MSIKDNTEEVLYDKSKYFIIRLLQRQYLNEVVLLMCMKRKLVSLITIIAMLLPMTLIGSASASTGTTRLIVHYYRIDGKYNSNIKATSLDGKIKGKVSEKTTDEYGLKMTFNFTSLDDNAYIGLGVKKDSVFPKDIRYVRAKNGQAEVWLIDGDAQIYRRWI